MAYHHLTELGKYHIQYYLDNKFTLRKITIALGQSVSTISREITRYKAAGYSQYTADDKDKIEKVSTKKHTNSKANCCEQ